MRLPLPPWMLRNAHRQAQSLIESTRNQLAKRANSIYHAKTSIEHDRRHLRLPVVRRLRYQLGLLSASASKMPHYCSRTKDAKAEARRPMPVSSREKVAAEELANAKAAKEAGNRSGRPAEAV